MWYIMDHIIIYHNFEESLFIIEASILIMLSLDPIEVLILGVKVGAKYVIRTKANIHIDKFLFIMEQTED